MKPLIALVDDDGDFLDLERRILETGGFRTACWSEPRAAFTAIVNASPGDRPAVLITDLMMSALDAGFSLARAVKTDPRCAGIPVIIVSAVSRQKGFDFHPRTAADLEAMSADAWFDKPVAPDTLVSRVKELLG
jgi:CheY-like chemotaxis protein